MFMLEGDAVAISSTPMFLRPKTWSIYSDSLERAKVSKGRPPHSCRERENGFYCIGRSKRAFFWLTEQLLHP